MAKKVNLKEPENANYSAVVVTIKSITPLVGSDNIVGTPLLGYQAIVGKDTKVGDIGIVFPAETQLSEEYAKENNLYRHTELNKNPDKAGYIEDNRRVKAMKFRGNRSDCLFMPLESLSFTKVKVEELHEGDVFDTLNNHEICKKYVIRHKVSRLEKNKVRKFIRVDSKFFPEHFDTDNYWRNKDTIPTDATVIITQKVHGTSIRISNTIVQRKLGIHEKVLKRLGIKIQPTEFAHIGGSRKVVKDPDNPKQDHFYGVDIWTSEAMKLKGLVPENYVLYGELIGWADDITPLQKNYTYKVPQGTCDLYIYRVAIVNGQGRIHDLTWDQIKEFCKDMGLRHVPELWRGKHSEFVAADFIDKRLLSEGYTNALPLEDDPTLVDEGVCIRVDGLVPYITKAKSPIFLGYESKMLDEEAVDMEAVGEEV